MEKIVLAKSAGFCYGVARAVKLAEDLAERYPGSARMLGPVIHNRHVVEELARRGMAVLSSPEEAGPGDRVLLRAHGEAAGVGEVLRARGAELVDATCPRVALLRDVVRQAEAEGRQPVMVGQADHPEVRGIAGWCRRLVVLSGPEEARAWLASAENPRETPLTLVSQTTMLEEIWEITLKFFKKECTNLKIFDTICRATHNRQSEAAEIAAEVDAMVDRKSVV